MLAREGDDGLVSRSLSASPVLSSCAAASPQSTSVSGIGVPPCLQLSPNLAQRHEHEAARFLGRDSGLELRLGKPGPRELFDDPGRFAAVKLQRRVESVVPGDTVEADRPSDQIRNCTTEIVVEMLVGQGGEEVARQVPVSAR